MSEINKSKWIEGKSGWDNIASNQVWQVAQKAGFIINLWTLDYKILATFKVWEDLYAEVENNNTTTYLIYKRWEFRDFTQEGHPMSVYEISDIWEVRTSLTKLEEFHSHDNWKIIKKPAIKKRPLYNDWANVHTWNQDVIKRWGFTFARKEDGTYLISRGDGFRDFTVGASIATVYEISEDWRQVRTEENSKDFHPHDDGDITIIKKMKPVEKK